MDESANAIAMEMTRTLRRSKPVSQKGRSLYIKVSISTREGNKDGSTNKRIFTSFAIEDRNLRDLLRGQMRNPNTPIEFVDMSVKSPWDSSWKTNCRTRIKGCHGLIAIITRNTAKASGQLWEIKCAYDEAIRVLLIYGSTTGRPTSLPSEIRERRILNWSWSNISNFIGRL